MKRKSGNLIAKPGSIAEVQKNLKFLASIWLERRQGRRQPAMLPVDMSQNAVSIISIIKRPKNLSTACITKR